LRDALVVAACILREFSSLRAFILVARLWRGAWAKRRIIMQKRRVSKTYMAAWFAAGPVGLPAPSIARKLKLQQVGSHD
jgi:hypothetical protein